MLIDSSLPQASRSEDRTTKPASKKKIAVVYTHYPHYRQPVFVKLKQSSKVDVDFFFSTGIYDDSVVSGDFEELNATLLHGRRIGPLAFQFGLPRRLLRGKYDTVIFLGMPMIASYWQNMLLLRLFSLSKILLWTHGWVRNDTPPRSTVKLLFFRLSHGLLLYGNRARQLGKQAGYPEGRMHVIFNSLDYEAQKTALENVKSTRIRSRGHFLYIGRLTPQVDLALAFRAVKYLKDAHEISVPFRVIGSGVEEQNLRTLAKDLGIEVVFLGPIYDEARIGEELYDTIATISPGKVGLTAMHSLAFGTPIITHDNFAWQMPEHEVIQPGKTGDFFQYRNVEALAEKMKEWFENRDSEVTETDCIRAIERSYTPSAQCRLIEEAIGV